MPKESSFSPVCRSENAAILRVLAEVSRIGGLVADVACLDKSKLVNQSKYMVKSVKLETSRALTSSAVRSVIVHYSILGLDVAADGTLAVTQRGDAGANARAQSDGQVLLEMMRYR